MGVEAAGETRARRADLDDERPPASTRTAPKPLSDAPWNKDLAGIVQAPATPIFIPTSSTTTASPPVDDTASRAKVTAIVHPERSFADLKSLTGGIFRLKAASQQQQDPEVAGALRMRLCMLQSQWTDMATSAGIPRPTARLDPFTAKPQDVARALMWSEAGGAIPTNELAADGGKAYLTSIREAVTLRVRGFDALVALHRGQPDEQKSLLQRDLKRLGDSTPASASDTVDSLATRRQDLLSKRKSEEVQQDLAAEATESKQLYMGLDGFVGTADSLQRYERNEALKASVSDSSIGSILASYLGGGDVEKMRALGSLGSNLEGLSGGAGVVIQAGKQALASPQASTAATPKRADTAKIAAGGPAPPPQPKLVLPPARPSVNVLKGTGATAPTSARANIDSTQAARPAGRVEPFSSTSGRLRTTALLPHYQGEDQPGSKAWPNSTVTYFRTKAERATTKLEVRQVVVDGKKQMRIVDSEGRLFDTRSAATWDGQPRAIFVMNADGEIFASTKQKAGFFHHSTLAGGEPVAAAGEIGVVDGVLVAISNRSGHYRPGNSFTQQAIASLRSLGLSMSGVTVSDANDPNSKGEVLQ